jgi:pyruvate formate lyase activating enzyme
MKIGGIQRFSLIDYPGKIASVLFFQGCPFSCPFCHNPHLVDPKQFSTPLAMDAIKRFLFSRKKEIEAVVFSGGEPTIFPDLHTLMEEIKEMGFLIKLDTSGIHPERLEFLLKKNLLDYCAMDIKGPLDRYSSIVQKPLSIRAIQKSISLLLSSSIPYEFRSTILPLIHQEKDLLAMGQMIQGARLFVLQNFRNTTTLSSLLKNALCFSEKEMVFFQKLLAPFVQECQIR